MTIRVLDPSCDASGISGFTVVVDVFRAFSVAYFIHAQKPERYIVVDDVDHAFSLRRSMPAAILVGERGGIKIPGFDLGNSPTEILAARLAGKTVIHTTTAGTRGLARQPADNEAVVGSFVNARALERVIRERRIETVNIYCTAPRGVLHGEEDYLFADYLAARLRDETVAFEGIRRRLREGSAKGFSDGGFAPESDFTHCMELDRFDDVLARKVVKNEPYGIELVAMS